MRGLRHFDWLFVMKIEGGKIKPCANCLRARQAAKDMFEASIGKRTKFTLVELEHGDMTIDNATHKVTAVHGMWDWSEYMGRTIYVSGKVLYDVEAAKPIHKLGTIRKITKTN